MNKQREALQMALDALESDNPDIMLRAGIAIREALAEPELKLQIIPSHIRAPGKSMFYQDEKPEQEPEPVAWRIADERDWEYRTEPPLEADIQWSAQYGRKYEPLYTTPPARKPLNDEQIDALELPPNGCTMRELVRAIERAHGIGEA
jgi:hypothetical protein